MAEVVKEALELIHHHPGRLRVRAHAFTDGGDLVAVVRETMLAVRGITRFEHSTRTGSILVEYEPGLAEPDAILHQLATSAGLAPSGDHALARARTPAIVAVGAVQELNAIASDLTGHKADLRTLIPAGLAALSAYSWVTSKEPRMPRWDNLLWWSYSVFLNHHAREIEASAKERRLARTET